MSAHPDVESPARESTIMTLGDLLYADPAKRRTPETAWVATVQAIAGQDMRALRMLYEHMHRLVFTSALRITGSRETAEEVTLDVFHGIWNRAKHYDPSAGTVVGWVMNQARSRSLDRLRYEKRQKRVNRYPADPLAGSGEPDSATPLEQRDVARRLQDAIRQLTPDERSAIEIAYFSEVSHADVAARLNTPLGTIKTRIRSGLQKLRHMMRGGAEEP